MTTTDADVRAWGRDQGIEMPTRGKLAPAWHEQFREAHPELADDDEPETGDAGEQLPALASPADDDDTGETRPRDPRGAPRFGRTKRAPKAKTPRRRVSLEGFAAAGWAGLAGLTMHAGLGPTGRVLAMQAPVAGVIVEDSIKGTLADKVLQPIARAADSGGNLAALLGPPVLVTLMTMQPDLTPRLLPVLRMCLKQWLMTAGPALKKQQQKESRAAEALGLDPADDLSSTIDGMLQAIFAEPPAAGVPDGG
jgi:hypothetical protein